MFQRRIAQISAALLLFSLTGCGDDSEPEPKTKIADLSKEQRQTVCTENTWETTMCPGGNEIEGRTEQELCGELDRLAGNNNCNLFVSDLEDISANPCSTDAQRAYQIYFTSCLL